MRSDLPDSRADLRVLTVSLGAIRSTASPRTSRNRSSAPETCRQSSTAQTRSAPWLRAHESRTSKERWRADTVRSPSTRPVTASTAATVCERLCVSAPITIIALPLPFGWSAERRIAGGHFSVETKVKHLTCLDALTPLRSAALACEDG